MAWKKSSAELIAAFDKALPDDPRLERRQMFGYPCAFVGGNLITGLHQDLLFVRVGEADREKLRKYGGTIFSPMPRRAMTEYIVVPVAVRANRARLARCMRAALEYGSTLPAKATKSPSPPRRRAAR